MSLKDNQMGEPHIDLSQEPPTPPWDLNDEPPVPPWEMEEAALSKKDDLPTDFSSTSLAVEAHAGLPSAQSAPISGKKKGKATEGKYAFPDTYFPDTNGIGSPKTPELDRPIERGASLSKEVPSPVSEKTGVQPKVSVIKRRKVVQTTTSGALLICSGFFILDLVLKKSLLLGNSTFLWLIAIQFVLLAACVRAIFQWSGFRLHGASGKRDGFHLAYSYLPSPWSEVRIQREIVDWGLVLGIEVVKTQSLLQSLNEMRGPFLRIQLGKALSSGTRTLMVEVESDPSPLKLRLQNLINQNRQDTEESDD
jgi:hypothetical protein